MIHDLMSSNVGRAKGKKLFIVSSCIVSDYPEFIENLREEDDFIVKVCPEEIHINMIGYKIASFIAYSNIREVKVLSVEGSPHCIQLHYIVEDINRHFLRIETKHWVLNKRRIYKISQKAIKISRHLSRIEKLIENGDS